MTGTALGPGGECDLIRSLVARWQERARGIGDDVAALDLPAGERVVASTDVSVENVHFRREWLTPREIGYRATAAALRARAAAAAAPLGILVAITRPEAARASATAIADGIGDAAGDAETHIVGGDTSAGTELALAITVLGHAASPLQRGGARTGDALYVTGRLGGPFAALRAWAAGREPDKESRDRFVRPQPRIREARWLLAHGATAAIDISDGLLGDAGHLAAASAAQLSIELEALRIMDGVTPVEAARSGEEYELLVAAPPHLDVAAFEQQFNLPLTPIGRVERGLAEVHATLLGARVAVTGGFSHFS